MNQRVKNPSKDPFLLAERALFRRFKLLYRGLPWSWAERIEKRAGRQPGQRCCLIPTWLDQRLETAWQQAGFVSRPDFMNGDYRRFKFGNRVGEDQAYIKRIAK